MTSNYIKYTVQIQFFKILLNTCVSLISSTEDIRQKCSISQQRAEAMKQHLSRRFRKDMLPKQCLNEVSSNTDKCLCTLMVIKNPFPYFKGEEELALGSRSDRLPSEMSHTVLLIIPLLECMESTVIIKEITKNITFGHYKIVAFWIMSINTYTTQIKFIINNISVEMKEYYFILYTGIHQPVGFSQKFVKIFLSENSTRPIVNHLILSTCLNYSLLSTYLSNPKAQLHFTVKLEAKVLSQSETPVSKMLDNLVAVYFIFVSCMFVL